MKRAISTIPFLLLCINIFAQVDWSRAQRAVSGTAPPRTEFISYDLREVAEAANRDGARYFMPLTFTPSADGKQFETTVEIPSMWLDRDLFLHIEGLNQFTLSLDGRRLGFGQDSKAPTEFDLSGAIHEGSNRITVELFEGGAGVAVENVTGNGTRLANSYIYGQPKVRIENYRVEARLDSTGRYGILDLRVAVANSYNFEETLYVGYDIYDPDNKLQHYDLREVKVAGHGRDTVAFEQPIYDVLPNLWSNGNPKLYKCMVYIRRESRIVEYIPFNAGFGATEFRDGRIIRNGATVTIRSTRYNAAADQTTTSRELSTLARQGINTILVDYPQPYWFYDLTDRQGLYVVDQANINTDIARGNRSIEGSIVNDPRFTDFFVRRVEAMYERSRNHSSIIAFSIGGPSGNGYNMYKTYQALKAKEDTRPVVYIDAGGEFNSDLPYSSIFR